MPEFEAPSTQDSTRIDALRIGAVRPLITPALLQEWRPAPQAAIDLVEDSRAALARVRRTFHEPHSPSATPAASAVPMANALSTEANPTGVCWLRIA